MKKKILFILPTLTAGGAERVMSFVAQNINNTKFESRLLVTGKKIDAAYSINRIEVIFLEKNRVLKAIPSLFFHLLTYNPDIVVSSIGHLNTVMGFMSPIFYKTKFIIREASVVSIMEKIHSESNLKQRINFNSILSRLSYKLVYKIVCQSKDMAEDFVNTYKVKKQKVVIINNPLTYSSPLKEMVTDSIEIKKLITVGRLSKEKGHLRLIKIISKLEYPFHYTIIGDGPLKSEILNAIKSNKLEDNFTYIPFSNDIAGHLAQNHIFLQGSYVEGFPNTALESCYVGTPVIAFNVPGGTKEIIEHRINGYLVENEEEYFYYLNNTLHLDPQRVRASVEKKFNKQNILKQYESLFN